VLTPPRTVVRRDGGLYALERALQRRGFRYVAGADEAGRGPARGRWWPPPPYCPRGGAGRSRAGRLLLTPASRERIYAEVTARAPRTRWW
jgi:ribonuclease HII